MSLYRFFFHRFVVRFSLTVLIVTLLVLLGVLR